VGLLIYGGAFPAPQPAVRRRPADPIALFRFPASRLQDDLGLSGAAVLALAQQSCVAGLAALRTARAHLLAEPELGHVLCVLVDALPDGYRREILGNVIGDGVAAAVVSRGTGPLVLHAATVRTHGALRDPLVETDALLAAYVAGASTVVTSALGAASVPPERVAMILPHNINRPAWEVLRGLLPLPAARLYDDTRAAHGHVPAADPLINLAHARRAGALRQGEFALLYNSGFGLHWAAAVVQV
jgi:3-oxoacyl-[acyl-carrier-protein] synthase III